jgi:hypothetical protein
MGIKIKDKRIKIKGRKISEEIFLSFIFGLFSWSEAT